MSSSPQIIYRQYSGESDLPHVMALVQNELSEPYVIYTFRYFLHQWSDNSIQFLSGRVPLISSFQATFVLSGTYREPYPLHSHFLLAERRFSTTQSIRIQ